MDVFDAIDLVLSHVRTRQQEFITTPEHQVNALVTKMVPNPGLRVDIERDATARATDFRKASALELRGSGTTADASIRQPEAVL
jgi:hypothetical protein